MYFEWRDHDFRRPAEMRAGGPRCPVVIVGAGPVGLALALDLAAHGVRCLVLERKTRVSDGSRALAMSRRTLQILDSVGVGPDVMELAITWDTNQAYYGSELVYAMKLANPATEKHAPMINLQQCWMEQLMVDRLDRSDFVDICWGCEVLDIRQSEERAVLVVRTPEGREEIAADYVVATDGARSAVRETMGLRYDGVTFPRRYVIADFHMKSDYPAGRRAWFDLPYSAGSTVLMHKMPFDIWRVDYQLSDEQDAEYEQRPEVVRARLQKHLDMIGEKAPWELIWVSLYRAHALTLDSYDFGRVLFAGDAAHQVPIFGGRGLNHGYSDIANLGWKLAGLVKGWAPREILSTYTAERRPAIVDTIRDLDKVTIYMTKPSKGVELVRDAVLSLSLTEAFVKELYDPFRTRPYVQSGSPLNWPSRTGKPFAAGPEEGAIVPDFPIERLSGGRQAGHVHDLLGPAFTVLCFASDGVVPAPVQEAVGALSAGPVPVRALTIGDAPSESRGPWTALRDRSGQARELYGADDGTVYLIRPDHIVAGRWRSGEQAPLAQALKRSCAA